MHSQVWSFFKYVVLVSILFCSWEYAWAQEEGEILNGSTITFHYVLTVNGKVIDQSKGLRPMKYIQGANQIVPGLEEGLKNGKVGDNLQVVVQPEKGYGLVNQNMFDKIPKKSIKGSKKLKEGSVVTGQYEGRPVRATIIGVDKKNFILDLNHPLAGKTLHFDIDIIDINPADGVQ